ncbi:MAG: hypothetical protein EBT86_08460 [Actinobacteria bacterium]|nr:hypothetical protein [Actinomycetota bacterium]
MAVVQISKIQIRRDMKDANREAPLPITLSSGEMAWCIDTNQLYIGSHAVGSPETKSNVEVLTQFSNIFSLETYTYNPVYTLPNGRHQRSIQDRLDDRLNAKSFYVRGTGIDDDALAINRGIERLYKDSLQGSGRVDIRTTLEFSPGVYKLESPIYIYSYTKIIGAGIGRTIFRYEGTGSAFVFVNDQNNRQIDYLNQCKFVSLSNFTLEIVDTDTTAFDLNCVRNSEFSKIELKSDWSRDFGIQTPRINSIGISMRVKTEQITCRDNSFIEVYVNAFKYGVSAKGDIINNIFRDCKFKKHEIAVQFGYLKTSLEPLLGEIHGPRNNIISSCSFDDIQRNAIKVWQGRGNLSSKNIIKDTGNNFGGNQNATFGQIEFDQPGNMSVDDFSDRHLDLGTLGENILEMAPYVSEVTGFSYYQNNFTYKLDMPAITSPGQEINLFRFPVPRHETLSNTNTQCVIEVHYLYRSGDPNLEYRRLRKGILTVIVDTRNTSIFDNNLVPNPTGTPMINLFDEYDYLGYVQGGGPRVPTDDEDIILEFTATPVLKKQQWQIEISYKYNTPTRNDVYLTDKEFGTLTYTYKILS